MTRFLLIRHATNDTVGKRLTGRTPGVSLNEEGQAQAQKLAERLASLPVTAVYSSPLERAVETAEPIARLLHLENTVREDFMEINFGEWTNSAFQDLEKQPQFQRFNSFRSGTRIPGGELMLEAQARIITGLEKLCVQHPQETVAVVSHADLIKAAVAYYAGIHLDMFQRLEISPASVSVIEIYDETARILLVNDTGGIKI
ncbi:histidine phosphatase family protein [Pontibacter sp. 172403-2]|uniref:histidine phosphatase family protein n=1 Tax=Pontibacter rufus TaxID=2791028 RepID=UPI0018AF8F29|nr:histidine phosphatase family protein [Pontibacter sp. 172403-2]MBF9252994.1 histidine phosphatase family protein [Pontibacter sp. 172403-2]